MRRRIFYSMTICDMERGMRACVEEVTAASAVCERLRALGIARGAAVLLLKRSAFKKTYLVQTPCAKAALGAEVAATVAVRL